MSSSIGEDVLLAFHDEIRKYAAPLPGRLSAALGGFGSLGGIGLGAGGLAGAGIGAVRGYRRAKEEGATTGQAAVHGLLGAGGGALRGATIGGLAGGAGGAVLGAARPTAAEAVRKATMGAPVVGSLSRFGQRQVHGLTGWKPSEGIGSIGLGAEPAKKALDALKKKRDSGEIEAGFVDKLLGRTNAEVAAKQVSNAEKAYQAAENAERMDLTSIPGYAKSLVTNGPLKTIGAGASHMWAGSHPAMKAGIIGLPAYEVGKAVMGPAEDEQGHSRARRVAGAITSGVGQTIFSPMAMGTQMLLGSGLSKATDLPWRISQGVPKGTVLPPRPPDLVQDSGQAVPGERVVSERAAYSGGEGGPT
jgi:hypothetical protein